MEFQKECFLQGSTNAGYGYGEVGDEGIVGLTDAGRETADAAAPKSVADHMAEHAEGIRTFLNLPRHREEPPPVATVCVDEDELDDWWAEQDVEVKADAFMRWALNRDRCYVSIPEIVRVPVLGECGRRDAEIFGRKDAAAAQADGAGEAAR